MKGSIDVASVLAEGEVRVHDGLLAMADGGVLYIDEINLLADHVVDLILDAAATGINRVERDALSVVQPARFSLIGTMNPEEGELRPQLLDRFAMIVQVNPLMEVEQRTLALRRRIYADLDSDIEGPDMDEEDPSLGGSIAEARALLAKVSLDAQLDEIALRCVELGIGSLRADVAIAKAARAHAALHGRASVGSDDVEPSGISTKGASLPSKEANPRASVVLADPGGPIRRTPPMVGSTARSFNASFA